MMAYCSIHGLQPYYFVSPDLPTLGVGASPEIVLLDVVHQGEVMWTIAFSKSFADKYGVVDDPIEVELVSGTAWYPELASMCCACYRQFEPK